MAAAHPDVGASDGLSVHDFPAEAVPAVVGFQETCVVRFDSIERWHSFEVPPPPEVAPPMELADAATHPTAGHEREWAVGCVLQANQFVSAKISGCVVELVHISGQAELYGNGLKLEFQYPLVPGSVRLDFAEDEDEALLLLSAIAGGAVYRLAFKFQQQEIGEDGSLPSVFQTVAFDGMAPDALIAKAGTEGKSSCVKLDSYVLPYAAGALAVCSAWLNSTCGALGLQDGTIISFDVAYQLHARMSVRARNLIPSRIIGRLWAGLVGRAANGAVAALTYADVQSTQLIVAVYSDNEVAVWDAPSDACLWKGGLAAVLGATAVLPAETKSAAIVACHGTNDGECSVVVQLRAEPAQWPVSNVQSSPVLSVAWVLRIAADVTARTAGVESGTNGAATHFYAHHEPLAPVVSDGMHTLVGGVPLAANAWLLWQGPRDVPQATHSGSIAAHSTVPGPVSAIVVPVRAEQGRQIKQDLVLSAQTVQEVHAHFVQRTFGLSRFAPSVLYQALVAFTGPNSVRKTEFLAASEAERQALVRDAVNARLILELQVHWGPEAAHQLVLSNNNVVSREEVAVARDTWLAFIELASRHQDLEAELLGGFAAAPDSVELLIIRKSGIFIATRMSVTEQLVCAPILLASEPVAPQAFDINSLFDGGAAPADDPLQELRGCPAWVSIVDSLYNLLPPSCQYDLDPPGNLPPSTEFALFLQTLATQFDWLVLSQAPNVPTAAVPSTLLAVQSLFGEWGGRARDAADAPRSEQVVVAAIHVIAQAIAASPLSLLDAAEELLSFAHGHWSAGGDQMVASSSPAVAVIAQVLLESANVRARLYRNLAFALAMASQQHHVFGTALVNRARCQLLFERAVEVSLQYKIISWIGTQVTPLLDSNGTTEAPELTQSTAETRLKAGQVSADLQVAEAFAAHIFDQIVQVGVVPPALHIFQDPRKPSSLLLVNCLRHVWYMTAGFPGVFVQPAGVLAVVDGLLNVLMHEPVEHPAPQPEFLEPWCSYVLTSNMCQVLLHLHQWASLQDLSSWYLQHPVQQQLSFWQTEQRREYTLLQAGAQMVTSRVDRNSGLSDGVDSLRTAVNYYWVAQPHCTSVEPSLSRALHCVSVAAIFERHSVLAAALPFLQEALRCLAAAPAFARAALADPGNELLTMVFDLLLFMGEFDACFVWSGATPNVEVSHLLLERLVLQMCHTRNLRRMLALPFTPLQAAVAEGRLRSAAAACQLESVLRVSTPGLAQKEPDFYSVLYAFYIRRRQYTMAAAVMSELASRLLACDRAREIVVLQARVDALSAAATAAGLMPDPPGVEVLFVDDMNALLRAVQTCMRMLITALSSQRDPAHVTQQLAMVHRLLAKIVGRTAPGRPAADWVPLRRYSREIPSQGAPPLAVQILHVMVALEELTHYNALQFDGQARVDQWNLRLGAFRSCYSQLPSVDAYDSDLDAHLIAVVLRDVELELTRAMAELEAAQLAPLVADEPRSVLQNQQVLVQCGQFERALSVTRSHQRGVAGYSYGNRAPATVSGALAGPAVGPIEYNHAIGGAVVHAVMSEAELVRLLAKACCTERDDQLDDEDASLLDNAPPAGVNPAMDPRAAVGAGVQRTLGGGGVFAGGSPSQRHWRLLADWLARYDGPVTRHQLAIAALQEVLAHDVNMTPPPWLVRHLTGTPGVWEQRGHGQLVRQSCRVIPGDGHGDVATLLLLLVNAGRLGSAAKYLSYCLPPRPVAHVWAADLRVADPRFTLMLPYTLMQIIQNSLKDTACMYGGGDIRRLGTDFVEYDLLAFWGPEFASRWAYFTEV